VKPEPQERRTRALHHIVVLAAASIVMLSGRTTAPEADAALPRGYWPAEQTQPILDKTLVVRLTPDLSNLAPGEAAALPKLVAAGRIMHSLYEDMNHHRAHRARRDLAALGEKLRPAGRRDRHLQLEGAGDVRNLALLYQLFHGPIATTLDNRREPFLPADSLVPGKAYYPWGVTKAEIESFLAAHPERRATLMHVRTVVRRADAASLRADLATLARHPVLDALHPGLEKDLRDQARRPSSSAFYAVPYPVAHADSAIAIYRLLNEAASLVEPDDRDLAGYLKHRARDLLANDYEAGDASWVKGKFARINAQIGAYETYDDELYAAKAGYGMSLMLTDQDRTRAVRGAIRGLQEFENALPYATHKKVIEDIPVGVYDVIADFGQSRSSNTATILPNESEHARRYGRIIMIRRNIISHEGIVASARQSFEAALEPKHHAEFSADGDFYRVLWHEIGHYLGPDRDRKGREPDAALQEHSATFEEFKADLVSLFLGRELRARGYYTDKSLRHLYASGVRRMLNKTRPRPDQSYGQMQLMQLNWFLEKGALLYSPATRKLSVRYDRYHAAVASLIAEVLKIQYEGDRAAAERFIARWTKWDDRHEAIARAMRETESSRFRLMNYGVLD
jgi:hypothetical protein